ncbi:MAG: hypothetical protein QF370_01230 [Candidatus Marinimicrobia bacterium]|nr:hypothetical protein [Candidatus Neomarinimicrobiota bacterium]
MKLVNQRILVWLLGFMLLFSAAWVFIGKYIYPEYFIKMDDNRLTY